jgi:hypothetical protein
MDSEAEAETFLTPTVPRQRRDDPTMALFVKIIDE